jgi:hypothetical protein
MPIDDFPASKRSSRILSIFDLAGRSSEQLCARAAISGISTETLPASASGGKYRN